jgi:hypothetical protein
VTRHKVVVGHVWYVDADNSLEAAERAIEWDKDPAVQVDALAIQVIIDPGEDD